MNNLRSIKKDISFFIGDFIDDCMLFAMFHEDKALDQVEALINEAVELGDELYAKVNHPEEGANLKAWYKQIGKDLLGGLDQLCQKLSALAK